MKFLKSHFWYNKRQRNGILFLILTILVLQIIYVFADFSPQGHLESDNHENELFQTRIDSLKRIKTEKSPARIFPFNPNYLTDFKGYQLGMDIHEIDRLLAYRKTGKFVNNAKEFQDITKINDSLLELISPFFKFPDWVASKNNKSDQTNNNNLVNSNKEILSKPVTKDLNIVTAQELQKVHGIGEKLAKRVIAYRKLLNGFTFNEQLYEVYYLDKAVADKVLERFRVHQKPDIQKLNINNATFKEILHLPYIDFDLTKKICNFRDETDGISSLEDLKKIDSFPLEKFDRIALYLTAY